MARTGNDIALIMDPLCLNLHYSPVGGGRNCIPGTPNSPKMERMHSPFRNNRSQTMPPLNRYPLDQTVPLETYSTDYGSSKQAHQVTSSRRYLPRAIDIIEGAAPLHPRATPHHMYNAAPVLGQWSCDFDSMADGRYPSYNYGAQRSKPFMENFSTHYRSSPIPTRSDPFLSSYSSGPHYGHPGLDFLQLRRSVAAKVLAYKTLHGPLRKPYRKFIGDGRVSCANFLGGRIIPKRPHSRFFSGERMRIELELVAKYGGSDEEMQLHHSAHGRLREMPGMKGVYRLIGSGDDYRHNIVADDPDVYIQRRFPRLLKTVRKDHPPPLYKELEQRHEKSKPMADESSNSGSLSRKEPEPLGGSRSDCRERSVESSNNEIDCKNHTREEEECQVEAEPEETAQKCEGENQEVDEAHDECSVDTSHQDANGSSISDTECFQEPHAAEELEVSPNCDDVSAQSRNSNHSEFDGEDATRDNQRVLSPEEEECEGNEEQMLEPSEHNTTDNDNNQCDKVDGGILSPQPEEVTQLSSNPQERDVISPEAEDEQADAEYTLTLHGNETEYPKEEDGDHYEQAMASPEPELANETVDHCLESSPHWDHDQRSSSQEEISGADNSAAKVALMKSEAARRMADLDKLINEHQQIVKEIKRTQSCQGSLECDPRSYSSEAAEAEQVSRASSAGAGVSCCSEREEAEAAEVISQRSSSPASELDQSVEAVSDAENHEQPDTANKTMSDDEE